jgi:drug/metabolite transporter (DMT)-like permease
LLKKSADKHYAGLKIYLNKETIIGYGIFLLATFVAVLLYRYIALSTGALLDSLGYIFTSILSYIFLKEKLSRKHIIGIILIVVGIVVYALFGEMI